MHTARVDPRHVEFHRVPANKSTTVTESLTIFSEDGALDDAVMADDDEEEDDITFCLRHRAVCFTRTRSPVTRNLLGMRQFFKQNEQGFFASA